MAGGRGLSLVVEFVEEGKKPQLFRGFTVLLRGALLFGGTTDEFSRSRESKGRIHFTEDP
jgi:hypothetical protein